MPWNPSLRSSVVDVPQVNKENWKETSRSDITSADRVMSGPCRWHGPKPERLTDNYFSQFLETWDQRLIQDGCRNPVMHSNTKPEMINSTD